MWEGARNCSSWASSFDDTGNEPSYATHALRRIEGAPAYMEQCSDAGSLHKKENNGERRQQGNFGRVKDEEGNKLLGKSRTRVRAFNVQSLPLSLTRTRTLALSLSNHTFTRRLGSSRQFTNAAAVNCTQNYKLHATVCTSLVFLLTNGWCKHLTDC